MQSANMRCSYISYKNMAIYSTAHYFIHYSYTLIANILHIYVIKSVVNCASQLIFYHNHILSVAAPLIINNLQYNSHKRIEITHRK